MQCMEKKRLILLLELPKFIDLMVCGSKEEALTKVDAGSASPYRNIIHSPLQGKAPTMSTLLLSQ